jgi:hypothetical protein
MPHARGLLAPRPAESTTMAADARTANPRIVPKISWGGRASFGVRVNSGSWLAFALIATVTGAGMLGVGFVVVQAQTDEWDAQSSAVPPDRPWWYPISIVIVAAAGMGALPPISFGWAKRGSVRRWDAAAHTPALPLEEDVDEERPPMPPVFVGGPVVRTRRIGAAPLVGFTLLGITVVVGAGIAMYFGITAMWQTTVLDGRGLSAAVRFGLLIKLAAYPLAPAGVLLLGVVWGWWFQLGAAKEVESKVASVRAAQNYSWNRQD